MCVADTTQKSHCLIPLVVPLDVQLAADKYNQPLAESSRVNWPPRISRATSKVGRTQKVAFVASLLQNGLVIETN